MYPVPNANVSKWTRQHSVSWKYTVVDPTELTERRFASVSSALASIACSNAFAMIRAINVPVRTRSAEAPSSTKRRFWLRNTLRHTSARAVVGRRSLPRCSACS